MNVTDPIADMLTRIRNASAARHKELSLPSSRVKREIARILAEEGFIEAFQTEPEVPQERLVLRLKYVEGRTPVVTGLKRISKPACASIRARPRSPGFSAARLAILSSSTGSYRDRCPKTESWRVLAYIW